MKILRVAAVATLLLLPGGIPISLTIAAIHYVKQHRHQTKALVV